ncbi:hypothetical protein ACQP2U_19290 [Nocardia sp. CA-084685]|uniref:hypothetical protein n=1 Tax=Nocardia sp. CA-084685 TaxID=3239970 RepID=UPI003D9638C2
MRPRVVLVKAATPLVSIGLTLAAWYAVSLVVLAPGRRLSLPPPHIVFTESLANSAKHSCLQRLVPDEPAGYRTVPRRRVACE